MTKKDYERAAKMIREMIVSQKVDIQYIKSLDDFNRRFGRGQASGVVIYNLIETFVKFFVDDNPRFNESKFRQACVSE